MKSIRHSASGRLILGGLILMISLFLSAGAKNCAAQVSLAWDAVTTNADGSPCTDLAGYKIYFGTASGQYSSFRNVGTSVTYSLTGLNTGTTSFIAATASTHPEWKVDIQMNWVYNVPPACTYSTLPASQTFTFLRRLGPTNLTTQATCAWTVVTNAPSWLLLTSNSSGSGNTTVYYTANANTGPRTGTLTIGGLTFTVSQSGSLAPIPYLPPASLSVPARDAITDGSTGGVACCAAWMSAGL